MHRQKCNLKGWEEWGEDVNSVNAIELRGAIAIEVGNLFLYLTLENVKGFEEILPCSSV